jgi:hypothetical protein
MLDTMRWRALLGGGFLLRRLARDLTGIRAALDQQNRLLTRLADHFAPAVQLGTRALAAETGVDYLDAAEQGLVLDYQAKVEREAAARADEARRKALLDKYLEKPAPAASPKAP